jgi:hypothetical protein
MRALGSTTLRHQTDPTVAEAVALAGDRTHAHFQKV